LTLDGFTSAELQLVSFYRNNYQATSIITITEWAALPAPEPSLAVLLGAGLLVLGARRGLARRD
jgi:hypothetical protein